jgi:23S rRNA (adenine2030-N6)-methyltransferase
MNYRHAYHAGNFADVLKHVALVALLLHLRKKEKPFAVIDTHAGRGLYDLGGEEAGKTSEAQSGIARLRSSVNDPPALAAYLEMARGFGTNHYPGSPVIAAKLLRPQDRLVAIEKHPQEFAALAQLLSRFANTNAVEADGYERLPKLLPPAKRRGLVLVDPPYERHDEFVEAAHALIAAHKRFATGIYVWWYPLKSGAEADAAIGEVLNAGIGRILQLELNVGRASSEPGRLSAASLLVINPPFGFDQEMRQVLNTLAAQLKQGEDASFKVELLAGEDI